MHHRVINLISHNEKKNPLAGHTGAKKENELTSNQINETHFRSA